MNRRLARLLGAGVVASTLGAGCLLGVSSASAGDGCIGPGYEGCQWDGEYNSKRHYGDAGYFYDEHGHRFSRETARRNEEKRARRAAHEGDRDRRRDRDRDRDRPTRYPDYVDGYFFGLSDYQDDWIRGMLAGSDGGRDFTVPYGHPGHPWGPISYGPTYECRDNGGGAPLDCDPAGRGQPPTGPGAPGDPTPAPTSAPEPSRPPTTPAVPPPAARPPVPAPQALPPPAEGPPFRLILLTFLGSAGAVGTGYVLLRRRGMGPLARG